GAGGPANPRRAIEPGFGHWRIPPSPLANGSRPTAKLAKSPCFMERGCWHFACPSLGHASSKRPSRPGHGRATMHWLLRPHAEAGALLRRAEERIAEDRPFLALRPSRGASQASRRRARVWLGSVLLAVGHRLLQTSPRPGAPA